MSAINELDALCIVMPPDLCPFTDQNHRRYLAVIGHQDVGNPAGVVYRALGRGFAAEPAAKLIRRVCTELAIDTVDGTRRVHGQQLTPEAYIQRWRSRLSRPVTLERLELDKRLRACAVFQWLHEPALACRKARWIQPPFESLGDLLAAHRVQPAAMGRLTRMEIDLAKPNGARDAWWAEDHLSGLDQATHAIDVRVELRPAPPRRPPHALPPVQPRSAPAVASPESLQP